MESDKKQTPHAVNSLEGLTDIVEKVSQCHFVLMQIAKNPVYTDMHNYDTSYHTNIEGLDNDAPK
jgi:hypothetical protein